MAAASLRLVLGDQLSRANPVLAELDAAADRVVMIEAPGEATHVRSHKARIALFLSAMRHFAEALRADGVQLLTGHQAVRVEVVDGEKRLVARHQDAAKVGINKDQFLCANRWVQKKSGAAAGLR